MKHLTDFEIGLVVREELFPVYQTLPKQRSVVS